MYIFFAVLLTAIFLYMMYDALTEFIKAWRIVYRENLEYMNSLYWEMAVERFEKEEREKQAKCELKN